MSKLRLLLVSIGIVLIVGGAGYMLVGKNHQQVVTSVSTPTAATFSPSPQPTSLNTIPQWNTYTSPEKDYTFSYPASSGWAIDRRANTPWGSVIDVICNPCGIPATVIDFEVEHLKHETSDEFMKETSWIPRDNFKKTTINGYDAVEALQLATQNVNWILYFISHNGRGYEFGYGLKDQQNITRLNQVLPPKPDILSTFRFTP